MGEPGFGLQYTLMKVPFSGGEPVKVMEGVVMNFAESVDGKTLFYSRAESASLRDNLAIWSRPVVGGPEQLVLPRARIWAVGSDKLYVLTEKSTIDGYTFSGKRIRTMAKVAHFAWSLPMSVSPDNRAILIAYQRHQSIEIDMIQGLY
jgi:hypothetical protein